MPLKTFTIPEAGKTANVQLTGLSVYVVKSPAYADALDAPRLSFNNAGGGFPMLLGSLIGSDQGKFDKLVVQGTPASAGDEVTLLSIATCQQTSLDLSRPPEQFFYGATSRLAMDGSVKTFLDFDQLLVFDEEGNPPVEIILSAAGGDIAYTWQDEFAFFGAPVVDGSNYVMKDGEKPIRIKGNSAIQRLSLINAVSAETADLVITPIFAAPYEVVFG